MRVTEARLAATTPKYDFPFKKARTFQNDALEWMHGDEKDVAVLHAPTGAGKTATFFEMCRKPGKTLLVYPTNALIRQQRDILKAEGIDAELISGKLLQHSGKKRTAELRGRVEMNDVIVTNPDILHAVLGGTYVDPANKLPELFDLFGQVIYDEFHFYDEFAASGIIMQIHTLMERSTPKIMLASATPNQGLLDTLEDLHQVREITPQYDEEGGTFRHDTQIKRVSSKRIWENREELGSLLSNLVQEYDHNEPRIVLVFNSVYDSNRFYDYMSQEFPGVFARMEKDNGYDTRQKDDVDPENHLILNTTSKGEVGLDYDVQHLFMEKPHTASSFIQRFGRAGRQSPATVYLYKTGQLPWDNEMTFPEFEQAARNTIGEQTDNPDRLQNLLGLRAAYALQNREDVQNEEIRQDFEEYRTYAKWAKFLTTLDQLLEEQQMPPLDTGTRRILKFVQHLTTALGSLRGQTLNYTIRYPRGDEMAETSYGLISVFKNYRLTEVDAAEERIAVEPEDRDRQPSLTITLPAYKNQEDVRDTYTEVERRLNEKFRRRIDNSSLETKNISAGLLHEFFSTVSILDCLIPASITYDGYTFHIAWENDIPEITDIERV